MSTHVTDLPEEHFAPPFQLLDLPDDILATVVSTGLTSVSDVASVSATSKRLHRISKRAPFRLHVNEMLQTTSASPASATTQEDAQAQLHEILVALCRSFPGTVELNLASLPLGNEGVVFVQTHLPSLAFLKLSGCKKLTSDAVGAVANTLPTAGPASALRCVDLQRCYQLSAEDLTTLINASIRPGSKLSCAALSHLDFSSWTFPINIASSLSLQQPPPSTLRMLALHNGMKLTAPGLRSIVSACSLLEVLCLGGSVLNLDISSHITTADVTGDANTRGSPSPTAAAAANEQTTNTSNSLSTSPASPSQHAFTALSLADQQQEKLHDTLLQDPLVSQLLHNAGDCGISPVVWSTSHGIWLRNSAAELASAVCRLPNLRILELTHCAPGLTLLVNQILKVADSHDGFSCTERERAQIWDMCTPSSVSAALHWRSTAATLSTPSLSLTPLPQSDIEMMLTAMVRCSSPGRVTALHSAAEDGDVALLSNLLSLGAEVDARDRGGASALFCACEVGHADAVATLLGAGALATLRNAAGEAPLYIAALRGHERVVKVLLKYFTKERITWQDQRLYGDGWTPLHAASVSGRLGIAAILLTAAGPADAAALVTASNRYGQTCVHVAARKGTPALVQLLIEAGGSAALSVADCDGRTAADVARRNGNSSAWRLLTGTMSARSRNIQLQRATTPTVEKKARHQPTAQQNGNRWVGRRLQQRKAQFSP